MPPPPPGGATDGTRQETPDPCGVPVEGGPLDPELGELLVDHVLIDAIEKDVDRDGDHHEVVETAEHRDLVRDEIPPEDHVAEPGRACRLGRRGRPIVADECPDQARIERCAAREREQCEHPERAPNAAAGAAAWRSPTLPGRTLTL